MFTKPSADRASTRRERAEWPTQPPAPPWPVHSLSGCASLLVLAVLPNSAANTNDQSEITGGTSREVMGRNRILVPTDGYEVFFVGRGGRRV